MKIKNPWLGLASYEEPISDNDNYLFCGRDEEILDVVRLIDNNLFVTLYGSSGIGKTSLLRAGVIPILRHKDYYPIYVRLSQEPKGISFAEAIVCEIHNSDLSIEQEVAEKLRDSKDRLFLWHYFAITRFVYKGRNVYPVIILDQFEEVFRDVDKGRAELLLQQIYLLLNDELEVPDSLGYSTETNYRFVVSIREDYLFVLEDCIDEYMLDLFKNNRYRLRSMKIRQARQVILLPGKDIIEETEKQIVSDCIIALSKRPQSNEIDTLLLSLVCSGAYEKKAGEHIVYRDFSIWKSNPMEVYYKDAIKGLNAEQIHYIHQQLIHEDGSRKKANVNDLKETLGEPLYLKLIKGKNKLLSIVNNEQVELLHDQLGQAVYEERKIFEENEHKKKSRRVFYKFLIVLLIALFLVKSFSIVYNNAFNRQDQIKVQRDSLMMANSELREKMIRFETQTEQNKNEIENVIFETYITDLRERIKQLEEENTQLKELVEKKNENNSP